MSNYLCKDCLLRKHKIKIFKMAGARPQKAGLFLTGA